MNIEELQLLLEDTADYFYQENNKGYEHLNEIISIIQEQMKTNLITNSDPLVSKVKILYEAMISEDMTKIADALLFELKPEIK